MKILLFLAHASTAGSLTLFELVGILAALGVGLFILIKYVPMAPVIKNIITVVVVLVAFYLVLQFFGLWNKLVNI